ncbi:hypothetical protein [Zobellia galactanivorans]|uniref:hypothetical protein n=1 Tax=Zobellia galactanivorans (strain DSM 12802 / CCUG 47099 / CIP 106680 / NCIMB 13871 / Dsij) TaxID=63186 RepID=UPI001C07B2D3|nr:hypothetical protein [Zobellia galactanivorans]MBU3024059.1 hypothetical protein [Zobellia galactanivorans]
MAEKIKHPFYEFEIIPSGCAVELLVNAMPCFQNYLKGGMAVDWPVNEYILKSGTQLFEINAFPYDGLGTIDQRATIAIKVFVRDALVENTPASARLQRVPYSVRNNKLSYLNI